MERSELRDRLKATVKAYRDMSSEDEDYRLDVFVDELCDIYTSAPLEVSREWLNRPSEVARRFGPPSSARTSTQ